MSDSEGDFSTATSSEVNEELNGKDASTRHASMISAPRLVLKQRIRGALVPMRNPE